MIIACCSNDMVITCWFNGNIEQYNEVCYFPTDEQQMEKPHQALVAQIMKLPYSSPFYEVTNEQVVLCLMRWVINFLLL